jgi:hypothetical protein
MRVFVRIQSGAWRRSGSQFIETIRIGFPGMESMPSLLCGVGPFESAWREREAPLVRNDDQAGRKDAE